MPSRRTPGPTRKRKRVLEDHAELQPFSPLQALEHFKRPSADRLSLPTPAACQEAMLLPCPTCGEKFSRWKLLRSHAYTRHGCKLTRADMFSTPGCSGLVPVDKKRVGGTSPPEVSLEDFCEETRPEEPNQPLDVNHEELIDATWPDFPTPDHMPMFDDHGIILVTLDDTLADDAFTSSTDPPIPTVTTPDLPDDVTKVLPTATDLPEAWTDTIPANVPTTIDVPAGITTTTTRRTVGIVVTEERVVLPDGTICVTRTTTYPDPSTVIHRSVSTQTDE